MIAPRALAALVARSALGALVAGACAPHVEGERDFVVDGVRALEVFEGGADESAPVVVALHGRGGDPKNLVGLLHGSGVRAEVASLRAPLPFGSGTQWFEWTRGTSEAELAHNVDAAERAVWPAIADIAHGRKLVVLGFSQGAVLTYALACRHPHEIALAVPIAGRAPIGVEPTCAKVVALHGVDDDVIPIAFDRRSVASLKSAGADVELREFAGVKHRLPADVQRAVVEAVRTALR